LRAKRKSSARSRTTRHGARPYGAKIAIAAKTDTPNAKLPGTIHTAAAKIEQAGGRALALTGDGERHQSEVGLKAKA